MKISENTSALKIEKSELIKKYTKKCVVKASMQTLNTILPTLGLFFLCVETMQQGLWWVALPSIILLIFFILRVFVMMHDCGHKCLFPTQKGNRSVGFVFGVLCSVPQYVWSKHHDYHHATNGDWEKYRGPLAVLSTDEFEQLDSKQQSSYVNQRRLRLAPLAGFLYFIFNPRFNWIKGNIQLIAYGIKKALNKTAANETFKTKSWETWKEYRHMSANNIALFIIWGLVIVFWHPAAFFATYTIALSLAGALGIILFTVQHNYEDSHATDTESWCYDTAAIEGTSFLKLPAPLNWFTSNIAYHHVHHLSSRIPNYNLKACHREYRHLFSNVKRIPLSEVRHSLQYILWDKNKQTLITMSDYKNAQLSK